MHFSFSTGSEDKGLGPIVANKVLNKAECRVAAVGTHFGKLCYRDMCAMFPKTDVEFVLFLGSQHNKGIRACRAVEADFDMYTADGRVIEVKSFDLATIKAALKLAPTKDVREKVRQQRGV